MPESIEKDVDVSHVKDQDAIKSSVSGSDDKTKSLDVRVDVGEAESVAASLAETTNTGNSFANLFLAQTLQQRDELFNQRMTLQAEMAAIRQRGITNSLTHDRNMDEAAHANVKGTNGQVIRHGDLAVDRQWNVDEQGNQAVQIAKDLGVDPARAFEMIIAAMAKKAA